MYIFQWNGPSFLAGVWLISYYKYEEDVSSEDCDSVETKMNSFGMLHCWCQLVNLSNLLMQRRS